MPFDGSRRVDRWWCRGLLALLLSVLVSCDDSEGDLNQGDATDDFRRRVEQNVLPKIASESEAMLRNLLNFMPVFTEICATPFAALGNFESNLTALQQAEQSPEDHIRFIDDNDDNDDGTWQVTWRNVVFGADSPGGDIAPVDAKLNARYLDQNSSTDRSSPFDLTPRMSTPETGGMPAITAEGYYLSQNEQTGQWTLQWHAETTKRFSGELSDAEFRRVFRHASDTAEPDEIDITNSTRTITFDDTTTPDQDKGFTFYVLPGTRIRFKLKINGSGITADQIFIGGEPELFPSALDADNFRLSSALPIDPIGEPEFTPRGMFIWQELGNDPCTDAEDTWHIRFSASDTSRFTGSVRVRNDEVDNAALRVTDVLGSCEAADFDGNREFKYDCTPTPLENGEDGYDLCVTSGQRLRFDPEINKKEEPSAVFIGNANSPSPSPSPFTIRFDMEIKEQNSKRNLKIDDTRLILRGNRDEDNNSVNVEREELINPDQLSLDPNCVLSLENGEAILPRVRVTDDGDYSTNRFDGSRFELKSTDDKDADSDDVDFAFEDSTVAGLKTVSRFPDRGRIRLRTRGDTLRDDSEVIADITSITAVNGRVIIRADLNLMVESVEFRFDDQLLDLGAE